MSKRCFVFIHEFVFLFRQYVNRKKNININIAQLILKQYLPVINIDKFVQDRKSLYIVGSVVGGLHITWKLLRKISLSGNSKNPVLKFLHEKLRQYMNCGIFIRNEFGMVLPWQYFWLFSGRYVVTNYGSYGTVPNDVMEYNVGLQVRFLLLTLLKTFKGCFFSSGNNHSTVGWLGFSGLATSDIIISQSINQRFSFSISFLYIFYFKINFYNYF